MNINKITNHIKKTFHFLLNKKTTDIFIPSYKIVEIFQNENEEYKVKIQLLHKNIFFDATPEEILANDNLVNDFSPRDIRSLTYLGYLGINSPKYKILAQRLSEKRDKLFFILKKKGDKKILVKTAGEVTSEKDILKNLIPTDAQIIGYALGTENILSEKKLKEDLHYNINP